MLKDGPVPFALGTADDFLSRGGPRAHGQIPGGVMVETEKRVRLLFLAADDGIGRDAERRQDGGDQMVHPAAPRLRADHRRGEGQ